MHQRNYSVKEPMYDVMMRDKSEWSAVEIVRQTRLKLQTVRCSDYNCCQKN